MWTSQLFPLVGEVLAFTGGCGQPPGGMERLRHAIRAVGEKPAHVARSSSESRAMVLATSGSDFMSRPILSMA